LKSENLTTWVIVIIICVAAFLVVLLLPHFLIETENGWKELAAISSYAYTLIALFAFPVIAATALLALRQLSEISKSRKLDVVFELSRYYATEEMHKALITVWTASPEEIEQDWEKRNHRRM